MRLAAIGALAALVYANGSAQAQEQTLRFSIFSPSSSMPGAAYRQWVDWINEEGEGVIQIQMFDSSQLGKAADHYDMARNGIVDIAWAVPGFNPGRFPVFSIFEMPYITTDSAIGAGVFDEWYRQYAEEEMPDVKYCMAQTSPVGTLNFREQEIRRPEELEGVRMRPNNATSGRYLTMLGASLVSVQATEISISLQRGLIDGVTFPWRSLIPFNLDDHLFYHADLPLNTGPSAFVFNQNSWDELPDDAKAIMEKYCSPEMASRVAALWNDWENEGRDLLKQREGHVFYSLNEEETQAWIESAEPLYDTWVEEVNETGRDGAALLADLRARLVEAGAH